MSGTTGSGDGVITLILGVVAGLLLLPGLFNPRELPPLAMITIAFIVLGVAAGIGCALSSGNHAD